MKKTHLGKDGFASYLLIYLLYYRYQISNNNKACMPVKEVK